VPNVWFPFELPPLFPRIIVRPVLPFDLNVNLQPFLECHCPCTFLSSTLGVDYAGRAFRPASVSVNFHSMPQRFLLPFRNFLCGHQCRK
jgi:hypothetical protein